MIDLVGKLATHKTKKYKTRLLSSIDTVVIHHSGTDSGSPESFANYHVEQRQWPGIGYHYVIDPYGQIYRTNTIETKSYNVGSNNHNIIGICLIGNFNNTYPPEIQIRSTKNLLKAINAILGEKQVKFHRDYKATSCPGNLIDQSLFKI